MDNETEKKLDSILGAIQNLRVDLTSQIKEETTKLQSKLDKISDKQDEIENKQNVLEGKIRHIERTLKRKNVVVYNIEETETDNSSLQDYILKFFNEIMKIETNINEIDFVRRIGKKGENTRPLLVGFTTQIKKEMIMKNKSKLKDFKDAIIYIKDDRIKEDINKDKQTKQNLERRQQTDNRNIAAPSNSYKRSIKNILPQNDFRRSEQQLNNKKQKRFETQYTDNTPPKNRIDQFFKTTQNEQTIQQQPQQQHANK